MMSFIRKIYGNLGDAVDLLTVERFRQGIYDSIGSITVTTDSSITGYGTKGSPLSAVSVILTTEIPTSDPGVSAQIRILTTTPPAVYFWDGTRWTQFVTLATPLEEI